jgi:hypothetical protein
MYNALSAAEAAVLSQCRTGHSRLRNILYRTKLSDAAGYKCGATRETITHVIYGCPLLQRGSPGRCRGSRTQVERLVLYTRGLGPVGRSKNWTTGTWTKGKVESGPLGGEGGFLLPRQDRKVRCAGRDERVSEYYNGTRAERDVKGRTGRRRLRGLL